MYLSGLAKLAQTAETNLVARVACLCAYYVTYVLLLCCCRRTQRLLQLAADLAARHWCVCGCRAAAPPGLVPTHCTLLPTT